MGRKALVLFLGATDVGKTTLIRELGLLTDRTPEAVTVRTPVGRAEVLQLGSLQVRVNGRHARVLL